jgi:hypothetical protein
MAQQFQIISCTVQYIKIFNNIFWSPDYFRFQLYVYLEEPFISNEFKLTVLCTYSTVHLGNSFMAKQFQIISYMYI